MFVFGTCGGKMGEREGSLVSAVVYLGTVFVIGEGLGRCEQK